MEAQNTRDTLLAGTGFMLQLADAISTLERMGYEENLVPRFDHLEARSGRIKIFPEDFVVDGVIRFDNTSDPDDQSILYAISSPRFQIKGVFTESYGVYTEELSRSMIARLKDHLHG